MRKLVPERLPRRWSRSIKVLTRSWHGVSVMAFAIALAVIVLMLFVTGVF